MSQPVITAYVCPQCGAVSTGPRISIEAVIDYRRPLVPLWDGGPLVTDLGAPEESHETDRIFATDACGCRFPMSEWDVRIYEYASGEPTTLVITSTIGREAA